MTRVLVKYFALPFPEARIPSWLVQKWIQDMLPAILPPPRLESVATGMIPRHDATTVAGVEGLAEYLAHCNWVDLELLKDRVIDAAVMHFDRYEKAYQAVEDEITLDKHVEGELRPALPQMENRPA